MNVNYSFLKKIFAVLAITFLGHISCANAKTLSLYEQPLLGGKVADTVDTASGVILVFTSKDGNWIKVANPKNGKVGWVQAKDLNQSGIMQSTIAYSQGSGSGKGGGTYQIFRFGSQNTQDKAATDMMIKRMEMQQQRFRQSMQQMLHDMDQMMQQEWQVFNNDLFPMTLPVVLVPVSVDAHPAQVKKEKPVHNVKNTPGV